MGTPTKLTLGMMGRLRPKPARGDASPSIPLPPPNKQGGLSLMDALAKRRSHREFATKEIPLDMLSDLLWAAFGVSSADGHRTAPTALNAQEIDLYLALPKGAYRYDAERHDLQLVSGSDVRHVTGYQDFVDEAPLDLVFVADYRRMAMIPVVQRESYASVAAGAIAQNVYLTAASLGLATVLRGWIDREAIATALGLTPDEHVLLSQTVGFPKS
jgi:SagB-type dehydrogenase family enzyme